jgi:aspartokinase
MADPEHVRQVARIVLDKKSAGHRVVVVVSARARQTDSFIEEARSFAPHPPPREMDMLLSSGERISAALLSIALNAMGCRAIALSGSQAGIITDDNHTNARIIEIRPYRVFQALTGSLVIPEKENYHIESALGHLCKDFGPEVRTLRGYSAVSLIGTGITDRYEYLLDSLALLRDADIPIAGIQTSSFRISFLPDRSRMNETVRLFHRHFIENASEGPA